MQKTRSLAVALALTSLAGVGAAIAQGASSAYEYRVPLRGLVVSSEASPEVPTPAPDPVSLLLRSATLEPATVGQPYSFDFKSLLDLSGGNPTPPMSAVSWGASAAMPSWLTLNPDTGVLSGTPTVKNEAGTDFEVIATHEDAEGRQVFTIVVNGVVLRVTQISAGDSHTCAVTTAGGVKCWGYDVYGQLGDGGTNTDKPTPVDVSGLTSGVASVSAGSFHTCAVTTAGGVKCWGYDGQGQLGNDTALTNKPTPVNVSGLSSGVASVSAGDNHTCAVTTAGGVKCWGFDGNGQLGDGGTNTYQPTPVNVSGLTSGVASVSAGGAHTCAVTTAGGVKCWGRDDYGQLGDGGTNTDKATPVDVSGLTSGVASVSAGGRHTCAVTTAGAAKCWGFDSYGQLGDDGSYTNQPTPVNVSGLSSGVASVSAGSGHTCAVTTAGGAKCWGLDTESQLGDGGSNTKQPRPVDVWELTSGVASISAGTYHTCAVTTAGGAKCWGYDGQGQLGNDMVFTQQPTPVEVQP